MAEKSEKEKELEAAKQEAMATDEELLNLKEDIAVYGEAESYSSSAGGKKLVKSLEVDVFDAVMLLTTRYKTATHVELIAMCAGLETKMDLLRRMTQARKKKEEAINDFNKRLKEIFSE